MLWMIWSPTRLMYASMNSLRYRPLLGLNRNLLVASMPAIVGSGTRCWKSLVADRYTRPAIVVLLVAIY